MDDLTAFLNARLDEDEANARDAVVLWPGTHFTIDPGSIVLVRFHRRHDPARVLREVEAKRAILAEHAATDWTAYGDYMCRRCVYGDDEPHDELHHWLTFPCPTLRAVAAVYSDHPDYRPEWKP